MSCPKNIQKGLSKFKLKHEGTSVRNCIRRIQIMIQNKIPQALFFE